MSFLRPITKEDMIYRQGKADGLKEASEIAAQAINGLALISLANNREPNHRDLREGVVIALTRRQRFYAELAAQMRLQLGLPPEGTRDQQV